MVHLYVFYKLVAERKAGSSASQQADPSRGSPVLLPMIEIRLHLLLVLRVDRIDRAPD